MYRVEIRKNGNAYGNVGPYKNKADALIDAAALKRPGLDVIVVGSPLSPVRTKVRTKVRANHPALVAAARAILPLVLPMVIKKVQGQVDEFVAAPPERQIEILRKLSTLNPAARLFLSDDDRAKALASLISEQLKEHGDEVIQAAALAVQAKAGGPKTATVKANKARKGYRRRAPRVR